MKRIGNLYESIISIDNLKLADEKAREGKTNSYGVKLHDKNRDDNIMQLHQMLKEKKYKTSKYDTFKIHEPKERIIYRLPYFPDRIVHHAIMNIMESIWTSIFTADTFSCIKGRGIHGTAKKVRNAIKNKEESKYCLKIDIRKFYPSIDHNILKGIIRKKIKCRDTLWLLDEIIDSTEGVPIGNYLSQYFANLMLAYFDHKIKEVYKVKYYFRYADDMVFFSKDKISLQKLLHIIDKLLGELKLTLKGNYQVFPIGDNSFDSHSRGLDYVGYVFYHDETRMRKSIKKNFCKKAAKVNKQNLTNKEYKQKLCSWFGWAKYSDSKHLLKTILKKDKYGKL